MFAVTHICGNCVTYAVVVGVSFTNGPCRIWFYRFSKSLTIMANPQKPKANHWPLIVKYLVIGALALAATLEIKEMAFDFKATNIELHVHRK
jgi:hypothetical protein